MKNTQINPKLVIVTRRDLNPGYQAVQSIHSGIQFQHEHPEIAKHWHSTSDYLALLSTEDEQSLLSLLEKCRKNGLHCSVFTEPDIGNQVTSIAIEPSPITKRLTCNLPLALKNIKASA